ncbi:MAG: 50S ribosomal protein L9 [Candidatus Ryanbacteria bacterium RIFCSPHIGHO2_02_FULL_45_17b]|uniref:Large ribosomal subunit protein bL9 n=1 Tax=Candidatus Ryanbacteria bacterium RIFCSPHIGHO2_01_FULL_45_22 TaxID=1802114 RepID=A0A1G2G0M3_9BACT|nr:MAG: 50S ribosomal protein L9 [Candidatus Ryanbacteria bacterium RIFCSPHIGHO2_01_FULL_45_22]OGZ46983.1 MAG: 50S ribosomal protein L9 [Candidatus Ryanbacteria bacterium RIFCSPHIGHO2_02_FULL_45_17b]
MQVILRKQVEKLGHAGDVKDVSSGYFRNFLFPRGLAHLATAAGLEQAKRMQRDAAYQHAKDQEAFAMFLEALQKEQIVILRKATDEGHLFGSVTEADIVSALAGKGHNLDEKHIHLEAHIKELGTYPVTVIFDDMVTGIISITVERDQSPSQK